MPSPTAVLLVVALCIGVLILVFRAAWLRYTRKGFAFFCLALLGMGVMGSTGILATAPSSARRIVAEGYCHGFRKVYVGRSPEYVFVLAPDDGSALKLQTPLTPSWYTGIDDGARIRATYLDETRPSPDLPRAIALTILSGNHTGWHGSVDANWIGAWLLFPVGLVICGTCLFRMLQNRRLDNRLDESKDHDGRDLGDGQNLGITNLNLR